MLHVQFEHFFHIKLLITEITSHLLKYVVLIDLLVEKALEEMKNDVISKRFD